MKRVLLTGAAGKVGKYVVPALRQRGFEVVATDLSLDGVPGGVRFARCDLTVAAEVQDLMSFVRPDVIVHCAAVVAPIAYAEPAAAEAVNLGGTRNLLDAAVRHVPDAFFAFVSSYAVFGSRGPSAPHTRPEDPCDPRDNYGTQKLTGETWVRDSGLRQCALRLGAVLTPRDLLPKHPSYRPFVFMVSLDQPEHGVDVRDVARAIAASADIEPDGKVFLIGGDPSWQTTARELRREAFGAVGLATPPERAFRRSGDPNAPGGWFYESWMDTEESQRLLRYQRLSLGAFMRELAHRHRMQRRLLRPMRSVLGGALVLSSPYTGRGRIEPGATVWDDVCRVYRVPNDLAIAHGATVVVEAAPAPAP